MTKICIQIRQGCYYIPVWTLFVKLTEQSHPFKMPLLRVIHLNKWNRNLSSVSRYQQSTEMVMKWKSAEESIYIFSIRFVLMAVKSFTWFLVSTNISTITDRTWKYSIVDNIPLQVWCVSAESSNVCVLVVVTAFFVVVVVLL